MVYKIMIISFAYNDKIFLGKIYSPLEFNKEFIQLYIYGVNNYDLSSNKVRKLIELHVLIN